MIKKILLNSVLLIFTFLIWANAVQAGFGISPPYVKSNQLVPGSHYEQKITLLRSSADDELEAEITINAPKVKEWITIDKGERFTLAKGELQVPIIVNVDVPKGAEIGNYRGDISIRVAPKESNVKSGVAIALGARIDIDLTLTNVVFSDFIVRLVSVPDFEELGAPWNFPVISKIFNYLFYKVRVVMNIENIGNTDTAPSRVHIDVYDITEKNLLQSSDDRSIQKIAPFSTSAVEASFPSKLKAGQYWSDIKVYKDNEITNTYKIAFSIMKPGTMGAKAPSLGIWPWIVLGVMILIVLLVIFILIKIKIWVYAGKLLALIFVLPTRPVGKLFGKFIHNINLWFWRWIRAKAKKYEEKDNDNGDSKK